MFLSTGDLEPRRASKIWSLCPLGLVGLAILAPALLGSGHWRLGFTLHNAFGVVCHQQPERSFQIFGYPMAVCSRCAGLYLGASAGLLVATQRRIALFLLTSWTMLSLVDYVAEAAGAHGNWLWIRFVLGLLVGGSAAMVIAAANRQASVHTQFSRLRSLPSLLQ